MEAKIKTDDQAERFALMGVEVRVRAGAAETGGALSALEQVVAPGGGSPLHTVSQDKMILVLEGRVTVTAGSHVRNEGAGATAFIPKGTPHNFRNAGDAPARILVLMIPGGHEAFLSDAARVLETAKPGSPAFADACARHHVELIPAR